MASAVTNESVACPICGAGVTNVLHSFTCSEAAQAFVPAQVDPARHRALADHLRRLWPKNCCRILQCTMCDFGFADPDVAGDAQFYGLASPDTNYPRAKWEFNEPGGRCRRVVAANHAYWRSVRATVPFYDSYCRMDGQPSELLRPSFPT